jgi:hypothetical protein
MLKTTPKSLKPTVGSLAVYGLSRRRLSSGVETVEKVPKQILG